MGTSTPTVGRTTGDERVMLQEAGFIRVTGLEIEDPAGMTGHHDTRDPAMDRIGGDIEPRELGRWGESEGLAVCVTEGGDVWLGSSEAQIRGDLYDAVCPNGMGARVPCTGHMGLTSLKLLDLVRRLADPFCDPL